MLWILLQIMQIFKKNNKEICYLKEKQNNLYMNNIKLWKMEKNIISNVSFIIKSIHWSLHWEEN